MDPEPSSFRPMLDQRYFDILQAMGKHFLAYCLLALLGTPLWAQRAAPVLIPVSSRARVDALVGLNARLKAQVNGDWFRSHPSLAAIAMLDGAHPSGRMVLGALASGMTESDFQALAAFEVARSPSAESVALFGPQAAEGAAARARTVLETHFRRLRISKKDEAKLVRAVQELSEFVKISPEAAMLHGRAVWFLGQRRAVVQRRAVLIAKDIMGRFDPSLQDQMPDYLGNWLRLEQTLNDRIEDTSEFASIRYGNTLDRRFMPEAQPLVGLESALVSPDEVEIIGNRRVDDLMVDTPEGPKVRFFVHPVSRPLFQEALRGAKRERRVASTPTASARSLVLLPAGDSPLGVKVSLNAMIGNSRRLLRRGEVARSVAVSKIFEAIPARALKAQGIEYFDEPAGVILKRLGLGYLLREYRAPKSGSSLIPLFSLVSKGQDGPPLIVRMTQASGMLAREFLRSAIIEPLIRQSFYLALEHGLVSEPHQQNVLMEAQGLKPAGRFWYRDLGSFGVVDSYRRAAGPDVLLLGTPPHVLDEFKMNLIEQVYSYLRRDVFFAMQLAMGPHFHDVTAGWMDRAFKNALRQEVKRWTGVEARSYGQMKQAVKDYTDSRRGRLDKARLLGRERF